MRLLAFYPYVPFPLNRGAYYRAYHLLRGLARHHQVDMLALAENYDGLDQKAVFAEFCRRVELVPFQHPPWRKLFPKRLFTASPSTVQHWALPHVTKALRKLFESERYDAVQVFDIVLAQYFLREHRDIPLVADRTRVDLHYQVMEHRRMGMNIRATLLHFENASKLWFYERTIAKRAAVEVVCGPDDKEFIERYISRSVPVVAIPNGVDLTYFHPEAAATETTAAAPTILFCGAMDYNPNVDALRWYFAEIHERIHAGIPALQVLIVGKDPTAEIKNYAERPGVSVTGAVPDVRPFYRRAWLQIVPLRIGGGTRLKIVESMAMGTPVVSTTIGAQGLGLEHGTDILLADTAAGFARATVDALKDADMRENLRANGIATVRDRLSWPSLSERLNAVYTDLIARQQHSS